MRLTRLREGKRLVDVRPHPAIGYTLQKRIGPLADLLLLVPKVPEVHAEDRAIAVHEHQRIVQRQVHSYGEKAQGTEDLESVAVDAPNIPSRPVARSAR